MARLPRLLAVERREWQSTRSSGDVLQVQTSSRAGSEPNAIVTWSGTELETTWVFQTRPVARSVECRSAWAGWIKTASTSSDGQRLERLMRIVGRTDARASSASSSTRRLRSRRE